MPELLFFEWERDHDGYRLVNRADVVHPAPRDTSLVYTPPRHMRFERIAVQPAARLDRVLIPIGRRTLTYRPLEENKALFRQFADTTPSPDGVQSFANNYGLLWCYPWSYQYGLLVWANEISEMRRAVEQWEKARETGDDWSPLVNAISQRSNEFDLSIDFSRPPGRERPMFTIRPPDLITALWVQFAQAVTANTPISRCSWCPTWFAYGSGTGRRRSSQYCSDRCRKAAHRYRKEAGS